MWNLTESLDISRVKMAPNWEEASHRMTVRRFKDGKIETMVKVIRPMQEGAMIEVGRNGYTARYKADEEPTAQELEEKRLSNRARAVRRARQAVRFAVKAIGADHLLTLTYRENMTCNERLKADWDRFRRYVKKGLPACGHHKAHPGLKQWKFVACREQQDRGAWHLHVAVVGRQDIAFLRRCWYAAIGGQQDDTGDHTKGAVNVRGPSKRWGVPTAEWKCEKLAGYMTKYLYKSFEELGDNEKRYWAARTNDKPEVFKIWLAASSFVDAITMCHDFCRDNGVETMNLWASDSWEVVWCSG